MARGRLMGLVAALSCTIGALLLSACAGAPSRAVAPADRQALGRIAVVSALADPGVAREAGLAAPVRDWQLDRFVEHEVVQTLAGGGLRNVAELFAANDAAAGRSKPVGKALLAEAGRQGFDSVVLISQLRDGDANDPSVSYCGLDNREMLSKAERCSFAFFDILVLRVKDEAQIGAASSGLCSALALPAWKATFDSAAPNEKAAQQAQLQSQLAAQAQAALRRLALAAPR
jgi:hypothetical protein